ncbi:MAG: EmrB/QacA family drug resistance transporter, partial [Candidatus Omnitrophica bacterium]|nr:EmrB/QacA family drug resistance transporter [Candidatus Omnitrophota bacterium]
INSKFILIAGLVITAYSVFMMSEFNLYVDYNAVAVTRLIMGLGMGLVFIPLTTMAFATIKKEEMGNATSIYNLVRNLAGSIGIAVMTTLLARRAQFHQFRFSERLNPFDARYQMGLEKATTVLQAKTGAADHMAAKGLIYQELMKQSTLFSFIDAFYFATAIMLCIIPLVFLLKKPKHGQKAIMGH